MTYIQRKSFFCAACFFCALFFLVSAPNNAAAEPEDDAMFFPPAQQGDRKQGSLPVVVLDRSALEEFGSKLSAERQAAGLRFTAPGKVEPSGVLESGAWQPTSYGEVLRQRLDTRSFPSLALGFTYDTQSTLASPIWEVQTVTPISVSGTCGNGLLAASFLVFATMDWDADGERDWLVLATQRTPVDQTLTFSFWLVVLNPRPESVLTAEIIGFGEQQGFLPEVVYDSPEALAQAVPIIESVMMELYAIEQESQGNSRPARGLAYP